MSDENGGGGAGDAGGSGASGDENQVSPEEFKALQEKLAKLEAEKKKLEDKELNFSKLRRMKEGEISDEKKHELAEIAEKLKKLEDSVEEKHRNFVENQFKVVKDRKLKELAGDDKDLNDKIIFHYERLKDSITAPEDIEKKLNDAYILATGEMPTVNPLRSISSNSYSYGEQKSKKVNFADTEGGKDMMKAFFPHLSDKIDGAKGK